MSKNKEMNWKNYNFCIKINDGFCSYQYDFKTKKDDISIYDIAKSIAKKLKTDIPEGKFISDEQK